MPDRHNAHYGAAAMLVARPHHRRFASGSGSAVAARLTFAGSFGHGWFNSNARAFSAASPV